MATNILRARWFGWSNVAGSLPTPIAGPSAAAGGTTVVIDFSENLRAGPAAAQFTATVGGAGRVVNSVSVSDHRLTITLAAPNLTAGQAIVITYAKSGTAGLRLADIYGDEVAAGTFNATAA
jgi:Putative flagellar system-associated repeat